MPTPEDAAQRERLHAQLDAQTRSALVQLPDAWQSEFERILNDDAQWTLLYPSDRDGRPLDSVGWSGGERYMTVEWHPLKDARVAGASQLLINWVLSTHSTLYRGLEMRLRFQVLSTWIERPEQFARLAAPEREQLTQRDPRVVDAD